MIIRRKLHETPGLNTTSTADISFMLLIFFLVTTSMDVDKGLMRQLPAAEPQKKEVQESVVDKGTLMSLHVMSHDTLLVNNRPIKVTALKKEVLQFVKRLGKRHLISIESDRDADYNLYFQMQNELMEAYGELRNDYAQKTFGKPYSLLNSTQKEKVRSACPQRVTESYANAEVQTDKRVDASAEEQKGDER